MKRTPSVSSEELYENTFQEQKSFIIRTDSRSERVSPRRVKLSAAVTKPKETLQVSQTAEGDEADMCVSYVRLRPISTVGLKCFSNYTELVKL